MSVDTDRGEWGGIVPHLLGAGDNVQVAVGVWNVRHGGGRRRPRIARAASQLDVDVLVLAEWSPNGLPPLRGLLEREGWNVVEAPGTIASRNCGVAIACRSPVRAGHLTATDSTRLAHAVVDVGGCELDVLGAYVPSGSPDMARKRAFLDELAQLTERWPATRPAVLAGDFNCDHRDATGALSPRLVGEPRFAALCGALRRWLAGRAPPGGRSDCPHLLGTTYPCRLPHRPHPLPWASPSPHVSRQDDRRRGASRRRPRRQRRPHVRPCRDHYLVRCRRLGHRRRRSHGESRTESVISGRVLSGLARA
jgi:hypothetical protein